MCVAPVKLREAPADSRASTYGNPKLRDLFPEIDVDYCLHTHGGWKESPLWGLDNAKTIFVVRSIPATLYSYFRTRRRRYDTFEACLEDGILQRAINFCNSWGEFTKEKNACFNIFRYEDYKAKPIETFGRLVEYAFSIDVSDDIIAEAVGYFSFDKQKRREYRFSEDEQKHFHFKGAPSYEHLIDKETLRYIHQRLQNELTYDFGYNCGEGDE